MKIPENVAFIIKTIHNAGFEAFIVGGCVRDMLMGNTPKDWDITTAATPQTVKSMFKHVVDTGIQHGTVTIVLNHENYEVTTYRIDGEYKDSRHPEQVFYTTNLEEDLLRRDFTMNAIAYHPQTLFVDPYGGREDIKHKTIKGVGQADRRFKEDALRMLRAIRFACQLGFRIENETFEALKQNAPLIQNVSVERICVELIKTFTGRFVENAHYFLECDLLCLALPPAADYLKHDMAACIGFLEKLDKQHRNAENALALLFKDMDERKLNETLHYLKLDNKTAKNVKILVSNLHTPMDSTPFYVKGLTCQIGELLLSQLLILKEVLGENVADIRKITEMVLADHEPIFIKDLAVNGDIIKEIVNDNGKIIGEILNRLHTMVLQDAALNEGETLKKLAVQIYHNLY